MTLLQKLLWKAVCIQVEVWYMVLQELDQLLLYLERQNSL